MTSSDKKLGKDFSPVISTGIRQEGRGEVSGGQPFGLSEGVS